ncbi:PAS domain S-box protein, partial [bacterium]|nr:PAS domain S-box protein [bacterium]
MTTENGFINLYLKWNKIFNDDNNIVGVCATITSSCSFFEDKKNDNDERELFETRLLTKNSKSLKFSGILRQSLKEKEHIQKLLIKSEVRLGAIFELSTNTMLITEDSGKILMTNLSAAEMLDIDKNELTHSSINEILIVGEYSKYHNLIQIGKHIPVTVSYKMIQNFNEFCSVLFITKRNDYSSAKISHTISLNAEFDPLFEHSPQATLVYSEDNIIYTNNAFTKLLAIDSSDKLIGKRYSEIIISHNTEAGSSDSADNRHRKIKNICLDEEKVLEVFVTEYPFVLNNKQYNVSLFELIEEKEPDSSKFLQLAQVVEQTNDLVSVTDKNGLLEYVNSAFEKFLGYSREELIGKPSSIFKSGKHDDKFYKDLWETINSGNVFFAEFYNKKKSGQIYLEAKTISPIRNESGVVTHFVSTGKDISELKKIQSALYTTGLHLRSLLKNIHDVIFYLD